MTLVVSVSSYCVENTGVNTIRQNLADKREALRKLREGMYAVKSSPPKAVSRQEVASGSKARGIAKTSKAAPPDKRWSPSVVTYPPAKIAKAMGSVAPVLRGLGLKTVFRKI